MAQCGKEWGGRGRVGWQGGSVAWDSQGVIRGLPGGRPCNYHFLPHHVIYYRRDQYVVLRSFVSEDFFLFVSRAVSFIKCLFCSSFRGTSVVSGACIMGLVGSPLVTRTLS